MPGYANFVGGSKHKIIDRRTHPERHAQKKYIAARRFPYFTQKDQSVTKDDLTFPFDWAPVNSSTDKDGSKKRTLWQEESYKELVQKRAQDEVDPTIERSELLEALESDPVISFKRNRQRLLAETDWIGADIAGRAMAPSRATVCGLELGYGDPSPTCVTSSPPQHPTSEAGDTNLPATVGHQLTSCDSSDSWYLSRMTKRERRIDGERQEERKPETEPVEDSGDALSDTTNNETTRHSVLSNRHLYASEYPRTALSTTYRNPFLYISDQEELLKVASQGHLLPLSQDRPQQDSISINQHTSSDPPNEFATSDDSGQYSDQLSALSRSSPDSQRSLTTLHHGLPDISGDAV